MAINNNNENDITSRLGFVNDDEYEDVNGDEQNNSLEDLANKYMMKSPATLAMRRKSSV